MNSTTTTETIAVPLAEIRARLDALDWAKPVFHKKKATAYFTQFVQTGLRNTAHKMLSRVERNIFDELPPISWQTGTHDFRNRLNDRGLYVTNSEFNAVLRHVVSIHASSLGRQLGHPIFDDFYLRLSQNFVPWAETVSFHVQFFADPDFLRAFEAGLGFFLFMPHAIILFPRPNIRLRREVTGQVLHSALGPAIEFPDDPVSNQYWLRGVRVPRFVIQEPEKITRQHIRWSREPRLRRALIDQYGLLKYSIERGFKPVDHNEQFGATLYVHGGRPGRYGRTARSCVIELVNATPEPDGTYRHFARRVPRNMQSAHEAVAWTFRLRPDQYDPVVQT